MATHFSGDPGVYIDPKDREEWAKKDPIDICQKKLLDRGILTAEADQKLREEVNCLSSVTGARQDHSSGKIYQP